MPRSLSTRGGSWDPLTPRKWGVWATQATVGTCKRIQQVVPIWFIQIWSITWMGSIWSVSKTHNFIHSSISCCWVTLGDSLMLQFNRSAAMSFAEWGNQKKNRELPYWSKHHETHQTPKFPFLAATLKRGKSPLALFQAQKNRGWAAKPAIFLFFRLQWCALLIMECGHLKQFETQSVQILGISLKDPRLFGSLQLKIANAKKKHAAGLHRSIAPVCVNKNEETRSRRWSVCPFGPKTGSKASEPWEGAMPPKLLRKKIWGHRHRNSSAMIYYTTTSELRLSWIMDYGHKSTNANKKTSKDHGFCLILQNIFFFRWSLYFHLSTQNHITWDVCKNLLWSSFPV